MSQTITMRLPDETADWLKASARRAGRSVSELGATLFEEARRMSQFADIEFRAFEGERMPCLKGGLRLWKVVRVAQDLAMDPEATATHFALPVWKIQAALNYYEAFPEEIDAVLSEVRAMTYEQLKRKLPHLEWHEVCLPDSEEGTSR